MSAAICMWLDSHPPFIFHTFLDSFHIINLPGENAAQTKKGKLTSLNLKGSYLPPLCDTDWH